MKRSGSIGGEGGNNNVNGVVMWVDGGVDGGVWMRGDSASMAIFVAFFLRAKL